MTGSICSCHIQPSLLRIETHENTPFLKSFPSLRVCFIFLVCHDAISTLRFACFPAAVPLESTGCFSVTDHLQARSGLLPGFSENTTTDCADVSDIISGYSLRRHRNRWCHGDNDICIGYFVRTSAIILGYSDAPGSEVWTDWSGKSIPDSMVIECLRRPVPPWRLSNLFQLFGLFYPCCGRLSRPRAAHEPHR